MGNADLWRRSHKLLVTRVLLCTLVQIALGFDGTVSTACGTFQGTTVDQAPGVWAFRGLRYAAPPVDTLRWKPPKPASCTPQSKILATENGQACTQKNPIVSLAGVSDPGLLLRVVGRVFLGFAIMLSGYMYFSVSFCFVALHESSGIAWSSSANEKLLETATPANKDTSHWCLRFSALSSFMVGLGITYFSYSHHQYLGRVLGGEDCLFLNIYAHKSALASPSKPLPVLFFVHGGDLTLGSGMDSGPAAFYGGSWALAAEGRAIAVQTNYRLNVFGFLYLEDQHGQSVLGNSTNLGLLDQIAALHWVKNHIAKFGGDPNLVTIYGQSSGGTSIVALLASPLVHGLFHRAFSMSASPRVDATSSLAAYAWRRYFLSAIPECVNEWDAPALRRCLHGLSTTRIAQALPSEFSDPDWESTLPVSSRTGPVIYMVVADGHVVLGNVSDIFARVKSDPRLPNVPTVLGSVREECDINLEQVRSQTSFDNAAWPFTEQGLVQWGVQLTGDLSFGGKVWSLYKPELRPGEVQPSDPDASNSPNRQRWSQLTSDLRSVCGNIFNAKQLAGGQDASVYSYLFTHKPAAPVISHLAGWPAWINSDSSQYAFHMWDIILLFNRTAGFHNKDEDLSYVFQPLDFAVADRFREALFQFAETGKIAEWTAIEPSAAAICRIDSETTCETQLKKEECALFDAYGVAHDNWIVN